MKGHEADFYSLKGWAGWSHAHTKVFFCQSWYSKLLWLLACLGEASSLLILLWPGPALHLSPLSSVGAAWQEEIQLSTALTVLTVTPLLPQGSDDCVLEIQSACKTSPEKDSIISAKGVPEWKFT